MRVDFGIRACQRAGLIGWPDTLHGLIARPALTAPSARAALAQAIETLTANDMSGRAAPVQAVGVRAH